MILARPIRPPFNRQLTEANVQDDGLIEVKDHEGRKIGINLTQEQYEVFMAAYFIGVSSGAALEREALIFEYTRN